MKKILSIILAAVLIFVFAACGNQDEEQTPQTDEVTIRLSGLKGPTTIGMVKLLSDADAGAEGSLNLDFTLAGSADEITPLLIKGELDLAAIPANLASVLYSKTEGQIQVLAVNTLGVLYIVEKGTSLNSLQDLKGKTIYATGKGTTPEYTLRYILQANGIDPDNDLTIEFKSEPSEILALMTTQDIIAMLPQPYVSAAGSKVQGLRKAFSLTDEWEKLGNGSSLVTGVLVGRSDFINEHPAAVTSFLAQYAESAAWVNEHIDQAAEYTESYGIVAKNIAIKAIPDCNICCITGSEMKTILSGYLKVLYDQNAKSVGAALPDDAFYYIK